MNTALYKTHTEHTNAILHIVHMELTRHVHYCTPFNPAFSFIRAPQGLRGAPYLTILPSVSGVHVKYVNTQYWPPRYIISNDDGSDQLKWPSPPNLRL